MTPAEFKVGRESLGLTHKWVAQQLGNSERTVKNWEDHITPPADAADFLENLESEQASQVEQYVRACQDARDPALSTYRVDADVPESFPYPASWHRAVVALVAKEIPGLEITYAK